MEKRFVEGKTLIDKAIDFIQKNSTENLSLKSIAENAGFSLNYFDALFKQHTGCSPIEYSRVYKLTRSALELRRTAKTVLTVALDFGYSSPESFTRAFKSFYGITPSEYRHRLRGKGVSWRDMSGKIAISRFARMFPELKSADINAALDYCFTHNPTKYAEDIIGMSVAETAILTLGDSEVLEHFVYVSDYDAALPSVMLVCEDEDAALLYLELFGRNPSIRFSVRRSVQDAWERFDAAVSKLGFVCQCGYDMLYTDSEIRVPSYEGMTVRSLCANDMRLVEAFRLRGGCDERHARAIRTHFEGRGNLEMKPVGVFIGGEPVAISMPMLDIVRTLRKYDIGAAFAIGKERRTAMELLLKYTIDLCLKDGAVIGNANATEGADDIGTQACESVGLIRVARNFCYSR